VNNAVSIFYPRESSSNTRAPQMLDSLPSQSREIILANMWQSTSLTLGIMKSLYPRADFDVVGEGFAATCSDEEALKKVEDCQSSRTCCRHVRSRCVLGLSVIMYFILPSVIILS
jgi:hypothetical protein